MTNLNARLLHGSVGSSDDKRHILPSFLNTAGVLSDLPLAIPTDRHGQTEHSCC